MNQLLDGEHLWVVVLAVPLAVLVVWWICNLMITPPEVVESTADPTGLVGLLGEAQDTFSEQGMVVVRGELWRATSVRGIVERGAKVRIVKIREHLTVQVEKV